MSNYQLSYEASRARQEDMLREADHDRFTEQYIERRSFMQQMSSVIGYGFVHIGMHLLRYGRVERFTILRTHPAQVESIQSN